jgi:hypothetical protein
LNSKFTRGPLVKLARGLEQFADRSETVAHELKMAILKGGSSASASNQPDTKLNAIPTIESGMVAVVIGAVKFLQTLPAIPCPVTRPMRADIS